VARAGLARALAQAASTLVGTVLRGRPKAAPRTAAGGNVTQNVTPDVTPGVYPGDYEGFPAIEYAPVPGRLPDPGEVVWAWVPYEEDTTQGKTRPILLIGHDGDWLLGIYLSSVDHGADAKQEAREGRFWVYVGPGAWDSKGRKSYARVDRIIRVDVATIDSRGQTLDRTRFDAVIKGLRAHWNA
jgi:hypothetical protein